MKEVLHTKHGLDLGELVTGRGLNKWTSRFADARKTFLVVGSSNSKRLTTALESRDIKVGYVTTTNWKPSPLAVETVEGHIKTAVAVEAPVTVVFEILDNLVYLGRNQDGTTQLPKRDEQGVYHVGGELVVAEKEVQYNLYKAVRPLLMAAGSKPIVIITPFPRYLLSPCCSDPSHVTNFREDGYTDKVMASLDDMRNNYRSFLFTDRIRRASVINPAPLMEEGPVSELWEDPVHPKAEIFNQLADLVIQSSDRLVGKRKSEEEDNLSRPARGGWSGHNRASHEWGGPSTRRDGRGGRGGWRGPGNTFRGRPRGYNRGGYN